MFTLSPFGVSELSHGSRVFSAFGAGLLFLTLLARSHLCPLIRQLGACSIWLRFEFRMFVVRGLCVWTISDFYWGLVTSFFFFF